MGKTTWCSRVQSVMYMWKMFEVAVVKYRMEARLSKVVFADGVYLLESYSIGR